MMRKVVDSSLLQANSLREYLSASSDNYAVVPDFVAMEAYKGDTLSHIYDRMTVLSQYPNQVIVLKGTQELSRLRGRAAAGQTSLIDLSQTRGFPEFCRALEAAKRGDVSLQRQIAEKGQVATAHIDSMLMDMKTLASGIDFMAQTYSQEELKLIRRKEKPTPQMQQKMIQKLCVLAQLFSSDHTSVERVQRGPHIRNTFLFRYALCGYISILKRIENGTAKNIKPEKLRNDVVDINVIAAATYFDGLLTTDDKARTIYADAEFFLRELFPMPPWRVRIVIALVQGIRAVRGFFARKR